MERYWINAPSTHNPLHAMNGRNVLADLSESTEKTVQVFFIEGDVISAQIPKLYLSKGWRKKGELA
jgi:hypothetical protein